MKCYCVAFLIDLYLAERLTCLSCKHVVQPGDCLKLKTCGEHEHCYMRRYVTSSGTTWNDVGCLDNTKCAAASGLPTVVRPTLNGEQTLCEHCCNSSTICNNGGYCGSLSLVKSGPTCYSCKDAQTANGCDQIAQCNEDEKCFIGQIFNRLSLQVRWMHGCKSTKTCIHTNGIRDLGEINGKFCEDCCEGDLCNNRCTNNGNWIAPNTTSTDNTTTVVPTTSSLVFTSMKKHLQHTTTTRITAISTTRTTETTQDPGVMVNCNFESGLCNWHQDKMDDGDWIINSGPTPSDKTGPHSDHTFGTEKGHYLYLEASDMNYQNFVRLLSDNIVWPQGTCLTFWYHMYGHFIASLSVYMKSSDGNLQTIWSKSGNHGNNWLSAKINLPGTPGQIVIEGYRGADIHGDIAIDDITLVRNCGP